MISRILVALDGSPRARQVVAAASEMALRFGATLYPLRVIFVPPEFPAAAAGGSHHDVLRDRMSREAFDDLVAVTAGVPRLAAEAPLVRVGQPWRLILEAAQELDVDLIVMGSHGYHGWDRILGTTASRVANLSHRDVLVVHERADRAINEIPDPPYR
jgi:nucleotide-binding universal stress UspA family protein